jgi:hypothetical protein
MLKRKSFFQETFLGFDYLRRLGKIGSVILFFGIESLMFFKERNIDLLGDWPERLTIGLSLGFVVM